MDPDARYGVKRKDQSFFGYKVHVSQDESGVVTSLDVLAGNENEGSCRHLRRLIEKDKQKGVDHQGVVADALYDSADNRLLARECGMEAYISQRTRERQGDRFIYDPERDQVRCGKGRSLIGKVRQGKEELYYFSACDCHSCRAWAVCVRQNEGRARVYLSDDYKLRMKVDPERKREAKSYNWHQQGLGVGSQWNNQTKNPCFSETSIPEAVEYLIIVVQHLACGPLARANGVRIGNKGAELAIFR